MDITGGGALITGSSITTSCCGTRRSETGCSSNASTSLVIGSVADRQRKNDQAAAIGKLLFAALQAGHAT